MAILAQYKSQTVEILDIYPNGRGEKMASVRAINGKPFVGGDKWPVHTEFTIAKGCELSMIRTDLQPEPEPIRPNLLDLALVHETKKQWYSGESVTLIKQNGKPGAYLKNDGNGLVKLHLTGYNPSIVIFILHESGWTIHPQARIKYHEWAAQAKAALGGK